MSYSKAWFLSQEDIRYLFFGGYKPSKDGRITKSYFSPWWVAILFPHSARHQGDEVTLDVKYVLRTDVMYQLK